MLNTDIIYGTDKVQSFWDLYDTGIKDRYGVMKVSLKHCEESLSDLLFHLYSIGVTLLAVRRNGYLMNPGYEGLIIRKPIDFSILDGKHTDRSFELCCVDIKLDEDDYDNLGPYMTVGSYSECEALCTFKPLEILRAVYGSKGIYDKTEWAIDRLKNNLCIDGWTGYEEPTDPVLKNIIDRAFECLFVDNKPKPLYTYREKDMCYLVLLNLDSKGKIHWNILQYDEGKMREKYLWASQLDITDERLLYNVGVLIDYPCRQKTFTGLGYEISMSDSEFKKLLPDWLYEYQSDGVGHPTITLDII